MRGIVIAAGMGIRMAPFTESRPKCMLPIAGRPLLEWTVDHLRSAGCDEIVVVVGHCAEAIRLPGIRRVTNHEYPSNNILHSLMMAREFLDGPVMVSYSDIWVEPQIHQLLAATAGDIALAVDRDWRPYYRGRTQHPISEAENVEYDQDAKVVRIGKIVGATASQEGLEVGEFLGLWRMSAAGTERLRSVFEELDRRLDKRDPFQAAKEWQKAYITDMIQELIDRGDSIQCALVERGWAELDTPQDYERLSSIAEQQRLWTIAGVESAGAATSS